MIFAAFPDSDWGPVADEFDRILVAFEDWSRCASC